MPTSLPSQSLVLVAILPSPRDLEIARVLGWYRIPFKKAPKVIDVDYLAFYQTSSFGESERWRITHTAEVRGHELTTRAELLRDEPDHPRAHEEYYKIQIGPLMPLPAPIHAEAWRRMTFFYTTGEYINNANSLKDLVVKSDEREILWSSLRERAAVSGSYLVDNQPGIELDPAWLELLGVFGLADDKDSPCRPTG